MRIVFAVPFFEVGGVETVLLRLARALRARGHEVTVLATDRPGAWWDQLAINGIPAEYLSCNASFSRAQHARALARRLGEFDVVLLNHARLAQAALRWLPDRVAAIPVLHNDQRDIYEVGCASPAAWNVAVAVGPKVFDEAVRRVADKPVVHLRSGVDLPSQDALSHRSALDGSVRLLFLGRIFHEQKGVFLLPEIMKELRARGVEATLTIVGEGPDSAELRRRFSADNLSPLVTFSGRVANDEVYEYLLGHHVLLLPSFFEGLPIGLIEAQACGCVAVATRLRGITDTVVLHGETGFLAPRGDAGRFADHVAQLANQPSSWRRMSAAAAERARRVFSVDAMGQAYARLLEDVHAGRYPLAAPRRAAPRSGTGVLRWHDYLPVRIAQVLDAIARLRMRDRGSR